MLGFVLLRRGSVGSCLVSVSGAPRCVASPISSPPETLQRPSFSTPCSLSSLVVLSSLPRLHVFQSFNRTDRASSAFLADPRTAPSHLHRQLEENRFFPPPSADLHMMSTRLPPSSARRRLRVSLPLSFLPPPPDGKVRKPGQQRAVALLGLVTSCRPGAGEAVQPKFEALRLWAWWMYGREVLSLLTVRGTRLYTRSCPLSVKFLRGCFNTLRAELLHLADCLAFGERDSRVSVDAVETKSCIQCYELTCRRSNA